MWGVVWVIKLGIVVGLELEYFLFSGYRDVGGVGLGLSFLWKLDCVR